MEYSIFYLIRGEAGKDHVLLAKEISKKFKIGDVSERLPPHLTLKIPFETHNIEDICAVVEKVKVRFSQSPFLLSGFGNFRKEVIFVDVQPSQTLLNMTSQLLEELRKIPHMTFGSYEDKTPIFHATLGYCDSPQIFFKIWKYLSRKKFHHPVNFDNVAIMKKEKGKWHIYKVFEIK